MGAKKLANADIWLFSMNFSEVKFANNENNPSPVPPDMPHFTASSCPPCEAKPIANLSVLYTAHREQCKK